MQIGKFRKQIAKLGGSADLEETPGPLPSTPVETNTQSDGGTFAPPPAAQGRADKQTPERWRAFIDRISIDAIEGWAMDTLNPGTHVTVEAVTSKGKTAVAVAHLYRQDVEEAGYGDGHCGFFIDLSRLSMEGESAIVRFAGSRHPITADPIEFDPARAVFTTDMPPTYKALMELLAAETLQVAESAGVAR